MAEIELDRRPARAAVGASLELERSSQMWSMRRKALDNRKQEQ